MDKEELKSKIDLNRIGELEIEKIKGISEIPEDTFRIDYLMDEVGHYIYPINPLEMILINEIKELKARIVELEK